MSFARSASKHLFSATDRLTASPSGPRILIYHQIEVVEGKQMELAPEDFAWQMEYLSQQHEVVSLDQAVERWSEPGSERLVVLSFDDGYLSFYENAFPDLVERRFPFVLYLTTSTLGLADNTHLEASHISEMMSSGLMTLGAHTHTHPDMRTLGRDEVRTELETSDGLIDELFGIEPVHFAYPWGYWSEAAHSVVSERYRTAVLGGVVREANGFDAHRISRFPIQMSDGRKFFKARLRGGLMWEERLRRRLRGYDGP